MLQAVDLTNQGGFYPNVINNALDRLTIFAQQLNDAAERAVKVPISSSEDPDDLIASVIAAAASAAASAATATSAAAAAEAAVPAGALGFTPVNITGDTMTGGLEVPSLVINGGPSITSITTAAKNVLDDATVADMRTTLELATVGQDEAKAGTATTTRAWTAERVKQAIAALATGVGIGQTWQDVKASRALATVYTNSTGKPIQVSATLNHPSTLIGAAKLTVGGVVVAEEGVNQGSAGAQNSNVAAIVPDGTTYQVDTTNAGTILHWTELR
jgi:hypothetical protein